MSLRAGTLARLEESHRYSASYRGGFANHLPMALVALDEMGASDAVIAGFADRYAAAHLEPLDPDSEFAAEVRKVEADIARWGREEVLRESLRHLAPGVASAGFHGAIRTAYAMKSECDRELAHALAYWSAAFAPIDTPRAGGAPQSARQLFATVRADVPSRQPAGGSIDARMTQGACHPRFAFWCDGIPPEADVEGIAPALIDLYGCTRDFAVLHAVTGCHAVRCLLPFAPEPAALVRAFWAAVIAAYAGIGAPAGDDAATRAVDTAWPEVLRDAIHCDDEHDVKLVYSCWREWQHRGGDAYREVAAATAAAGARPLTEPTS